MFSLVNLIFDFVADLFVVTRSNDEMSEIFGKLMESLFQVLSGVTALETVVKSSKIQNDLLNNTKTDC